MNKLEDLKHEKDFNGIYKPKELKRGINNKRYNMINCSGTVGVAQYQFQVLPSPAFQVEPYQDYLLTGIYKALTQKNRAGAVTSITDARVNLFGINRNSLQDDFNLNNAILQFQFYDNNRIDLRVPIYSNFNAQIFALQEGNFVVGDIVDVTVIFEFEYIGS